MPQLDRIKIKGFKSIKHSDIKLSFLIYLWSWKIQLYFVPDLPSCILIDEPELGLHPYAINILGSLFKSVSKKTQIIASTQSLLLVDQLEPEDLIVVDYQNDQSIFK